MVNQVFLTDKKIKDIFTYIQGMQHSEQIRMMFLCSFNGMRSINFRNLQIYDVYTDEYKVKDVLSLDKEKNKGKFGANYYLNSQIKKEFANYLEYIKQRDGELKPEQYLFTSQKMGKPFNRSSISRIFSQICKKFGISAGSHLGRHMFVSKLVNSGINICIVQRLANHRNLGSTQRYYNFNEQMMSNAVEQAKI